MKPIKRHKTFEKHYSERVKPNKKLAKQFEARLMQFVAGNRGYPLNDHALTGKLVGNRALSIAGDMRIIYIELEDAIIFLDIGTHNQVY